MAAAPGPDSRDNFDMTQSTQTWGHFLHLSKWVIIVTLISLIGMAIFLTGNPPQ